jgi:hypothetical protein
MAKKKTEPDFLHHAAGHDLSNRPEGWSGEKIVTYLEDNADDYSDEIEAWYPFEGFCGEELAGYIRDLADSLKAFYHHKV